MIQKLKTKQKGFTIIEVMIVLAIAGLILLIVFLAIPALQRAQRNTGRKEDAGRLVTAFQDFISNSSGQLPAVTSKSLSDCQTILTDAGKLNQYNFTTSTSTSTSTTSGCVSSLGGSDQIAIISSGGSGATLATAVANQVEFVEGATCNGTSTYNYSSVQQQTALFYSLEGGNGTYIWACENA